MLKALAQKFDNFTGPFKYHSLAKNTVLAE